MDIPTYEALFAGMDELGRHLNISVPEVFDPEFGLDPYRYSYDKLRSNPAEIMWWLYLFIHPADRALAGMGGYKGPPDPQGMVEIGYQIYESYRKQGLATEAANGLINHAFEHPEVKVVQAHTLAEENASVQVLKKCGLVFSGALDDPDDGPIWQWQLLPT
jgi:RimJ/RimL family protein N-acetyltransferase